jgi:glutamine synthetase
VASEFGVKASFMPKPSTGSMGNGCHHNVSLWKDDRNVLAEPGRRELHLTDVGLHALGGMLAHAPGSMMIMASTVNSYKRFWDTGQFAPTRINWGMDNKTCTVRLSANGRLEYKLPDASVNPTSRTPCFSPACWMASATRPAQASQSKDSYVDGGESVGIPLTLGDARCSV